MNFANALSGAASALTNAEGGTQQGIQQGNQINQGNLLDAVQLYRQQAQDQLAKQTQQANLLKIGADTDEAKARAAAIASPPPKGSVTLGPGQNLYGNNGDLLTAGPAAREDPSVARERIAAAGVAAHDAAQQSALAATSANQDRQAKAREYTDALSGYQAVSAANPAIKSPLSTKILGGFTGVPDEYAANKAQAVNRVKAAWQSYKDAGGAPSDVPELGLVSAKTATVPTGTKPTAKSIVNAAMNGQPLPE